MATHAIVLRILAVLASSLSPLQDSPSRQSWAGAAQLAGSECHLCLNHRREPEGGAYELMRGHIKRRQGLKTLSFLQSCLLVKVSSAFRASVPKTEYQAPPWNMYTFFHLWLGLSIYKRKVGMSADDRHGVFDSGKVYDQRAIARILGLSDVQGDTSKWVLRNMLHQGLPFMKLGTRYLVSGHYLNLWVQELSQRWSEWKEKA